MNFKPYYGYLVLLVLVLSSWLVADFFATDFVGYDLVNKYNPDYFGSKYFKEEMSADGKLKTQLSATKMLHYSDSGITHLERPVMTLYNSGISTWIIKSDAATIKSNGDNLFLTGQVKINRIGTKKLKPLSINTSQLQVQLSTNFAQTAKWARISGAKHTTEGVGLEMTFSHPIKLKFLAKVRGKYELN